MGGPLMCDWECPGYNQPPHVGSLWPGEEEEAEMSVSDSIERCFICGDPTGKAGRDEDSLFSTSGDGPFCEQCFEPYAEDAAESAPDEDEVRDREEFMLEEQIDRENEARRMRKKEGK
jgi:hypothetical protein